MDGGKSWKKLGAADGLPAGDYGRIGIAFARSQPTRVYAMVEAAKNGFYKSDDGGSKWSLITADPKIVTNRPFYFQDLAVDTKNENRVYSIHDVVEVSEDGGKTFSTMLPYYGIHPDHHAWFIHPDNPDFILDGNDGGIGISRDRGKTWQFDEKLPVRPVLSYQCRQRHTVSCNGRHAGQRQLAWPGIHMDHRRHPQLLLAQCRQRRWL
jgi:photosystem II stability/assembly factor-like uncharacterized protein